MPYVSKIVKTLKNVIPDEKQYNTVGRVLEQGVSSPDKIGNNIIVKKDTSGIKLIDLKLGGVVISFDAELYFVVNDRYIIYTNTIQCDDSTVPIRYRTFIYDTQKDPNNNSNDEYFCESKLCSVIGMNGTNILIKCEKNVLTNDMKYKSTECFAEVVIDEDNVDGIYEYRNKYICMHPSFQIIVRKHESQNTTVYEYLNLEDEYVIDRIEKSNNEQKENTEFIGFHGDLIVERVNNSTQFRKIVMVDKKDVVDEERKIINNKCVVCFDDIKDRCALNCGHTQFCMECIEGLLNDNCPICQREITSKTKIYL
jgi:hypothetical protein